MTLGEYLKAAASTPWRWGEHDCCAWPARWAQVPLPAYSNGVEAAQMIHDAGGLIPLWERHGDGYADTVHRPQTGDVGIIEAINRDRQIVETGAIFTGERWAFIPLIGGLATVSADALRIWRPRCLR